jgi:hypothetical protein
MSILVQFGYARGGERDSPHGAGQAFFAVSTGTAPGGRKLCLIRARSKMLRRSTLLLGWMGARDPVVHWPVTLSGILLSGPGRQKAQAIVGKPLRMVKSGPATIDLLNLCGKIYCLSLSSPFSNPFPAI